MHGNHNVTEETAAVPDALMRSSPEPIAFTPSVKSVKKGVQISHWIDYTMCMHIQNVLAAIEQLSAKELHRIEEAKAQRRRKTGADPVSTVEERRSYRNGILQLERRAYRRKDGGLTTRGPYWYFHYREGVSRRPFTSARRTTPKARWTRNSGTSRYG
jgi:hypothetical protein